MVVFCINFIPVSYTHLDVYKRQEYYHPQEQVSCIVVTTEPEEAVRAAVQPLPGIPLLVLTPKMAVETAQTGEADA